MKKSLIALAVAATVSVPALADNSTVTLYGTLNVDFENVEADGSSVAGATNLDRRNRVSSNSSNIGFKGVEPLGGGLDAWFQVESLVSPDAGGGTWSSRNSAVGLKGGFGNVSLGQWDTPYKFTTARLDPFWATSIASYMNVVGGNSTPTAANAANRNSFDRRQRNVVQYWTPNLSGFSGRVAYSANEEKDSCVGFSCDPSLWSLSVAWENGPIYITAAYEKHDEYANTATSKSDDTGVKVGGAFTFAGAHTISAMWERLKFEGNITSFPFATGGAALPKVVTIVTDPTVNSGVAATEVGNELEMDTWFLAYAGKFGPHILRASYGQNNEAEVDGTEQNDTKARFWSLGYGYAFSKRTEFYAFYTEIDNDERSYNDFAVNPIGVNAGLRGADPRGIGVGVKHSF